MERVRDMMLYPDEDNMCSHMPTCQTQSNEHKEEVKGDVQPVSTLPETRDVSVPSPKVSTPCVTSSAPIVTAASRPIPNSGFQVGFIAIPRSLPLPSLVNGHPVSTNSSSSMNSSLVSSNQSLPVQDLHANASKEEETKSALTVVDNSTDSESSSSSERNSHQIVPLEFCSSEYQVNIPTPLNFTLGRFGENSGEGRCTNDALMKFLSRHNKPSQKVNEPIKPLQHVNEHSRPLQPVTDHTKSPQPGIGHARPPLYVIEHSRPPQHVIENTKPLQHVIQHSRAPQHVIEHSRASQHVIQHSRAPQHMIEHSRAPQPVIEHSRLPQDVTDHTKSPQLGIGHARPPLYVIEHSRPPQHVIEHIRPLQRVNELSDASNIRKQEKSESEKRIGRWRPEKYHKPPLQPVVQKEQSLGGPSILGHHVLPIHPLLPQTRSILLPQPAKKKEEDVRIVKPTENLVTSVQPKMVSVLKSKYAPVRNDSSDSMKRTTDEQNRTQPSEERNVVRAESVSPETHLSSVPRGENPHAQPNEVNSHLSAEEPEIVTGGRVRYIGDSTANSFLRLGKMPHSGDSDLLRTQTSSNDRNLSSTKGKWSGITHFVLPQSAPKPTSLMDAYRSVSDSSQHTKSLLKEDTRYIADSHKPVLSEVSATSHSETSEKNRNLENESTLFKLLKAPEFPLKNNTREKTEKKKKEKTSRSRHRDTDDSMVNEEPCHACSHPDEVITRNPSRQKSWLSASASPLSLLSAVASLAEAMTTDGQVPDLLSCISPEQQEVIERLECEGHSGDCKLMKKVVRRKPFKSKRSTTDLLYSEDDSKVIKKKMAMG